MSGAQSVRNGQRGASQAVPTTDFLTVDQRDDRMSRRPGVAQVNVLGNNRTFDNEG